METKGRILIIDDEEGIRKGCVRVLQPLGYATDVATGFRDGLQKIQSAQFDLILLDVMMPDGKGIDLLEPIREQDPETVPVLITGYATVELAVEAIKRGAYDFIAKPFSAQLLLMTVEQGLEKRRLSIEAKRLQTMERQVAELVQEREQAEKLYEFKSAFATMVAHELRSPVGAAQTLVRTLLRGLAGELNQKQAEILSRVEIRLSDLLTLINDLLTLAASKSLEAEKPLEPVNIESALERVLQHFDDEAAGKHVTLKYTAPGRHITVRATEQGLETVLNNLIGNAIKYTPPEGSIQVELEEKEGCALLRVADTGIGIPAEDLPHLGEEFFRAKNAYGRNIQGTGLGLSIVKEFVKRFGAQIDIKSHDGQGTTVALEFPPCEDPAESLP
jgi:signal transduction histidine kinase